MSAVTAIQKKMYSVTFLSLDLHIWQNSNAKLLITFIFEWFLLVNFRSTIPFSLVWWRWANFKKSVCIMRKPSILSLNVIVFEAVCLSMCVHVYMHYIALLQTLTQTHKQINTPTKCMYITIRIKCIRALSHSYDHFHSHMHTCT